VILEALRRRVEEAPCDVVLASGGADSTAVALAHRMLGLKPLLINVQYLEKPGDDLQYVVLVARRLGLPLLVRFVPREEALEAVQEVVRILRVFNPMEVVNCAAVYVALREAKLRGAKRACTGDGGDELCVGYSYMLKMPLEELKDYVRRLPQMWSFCAFKIGEALGLDVAAPFLQNVELLLSIPVEEKVKCGMGKCLLRAELAEALGPEAAWRRKSPVERGSGFDALYDVLAEMGKAAEADIPAEGAARYLYHIFKQLGYTYRRAAESPCPVCGFELRGGYCPMCGSSTPWRW
jgi:asparagine synthase (glutamine-hydrolysing)